MRAALRTCPALQLVPRRLLVGLSEEHFQKDNMVPNQKTSLWYDRCSSVGMHFASLRSSSALRYVPRSVRYPGTFKHRMDNGHGRSSMPKRPPVRRVIE